MRLRAEHVRVLRVQLLDARGDVLPQRRPEKHVVVGPRRLAPRRDEARLRPAHGPADLEKILHVHRRLARVLLGVIFVQLLQPIEVLSAQQCVQVRRLHLQPGIVDVGGGGGGDSAGDARSGRDLLPVVLTGTAEYRQSVGLTPIRDYLIGILIGWLNGRLSGGRQTRWMRVLGPRAGIRGQAAHAHVHPWWRRVVETLLLRLWLLPNRPPKGQPPRNHPIYDRHPSPDTPLALRIHHGSDRLPVSLLPPD